MVKIRGRTGRGKTDYSVLSAVAARKLASQEDHNKAENGKRKPQLPPAEHHPSKKPKGQDYHDDQKQINRTELLNQTIEHSNSAKERVVETFENVTDFSSFELEDKAIANEERELILRLQSGDKLVVSGEFSILVKSGKFSIMGAVLRTNPQIHMVSAPLCYSLPIIECISNYEVSGAEIAIQYCNSGIRFLQDTIPLFKHIWGGNPKVDLKGQPSFTTLHAAEDIPKHWKFKVQTLNLSKEWKQLISALTNLVGQETPPTIVVAGQQSAGKSTLCRHLYNSILTNAMPENIENSDGVAFLDLNPGQPQFSPPGQVSLFHLRSPMFGQPFRHTHISLTNDDRLIRSHYIGHNTPENDPDHYTTCAVNLFAQYQKLLFSAPSCPLIINTVDWGKARGMEILVDLLRKTLATDLVWLQSDMDLEEDFNLDQTPSLGVTLHRLPSHHTRNLSRTPTDLRAMQVLSYLHLSSEVDSDTDRNGYGLQWDATPLTCQRPWVVNYSEPNPGILGIMILGEVLPVELVATAINGTIVAIVVIEDDDALPTVDAEQKAVNDRKGKRRSPGLSILHDPATGLPYIPTPGGSPLDPSMSFCAGQAIIRGIDTANETLHLITPIKTSCLPANKNIVLVRGRVELPVIAFVEDGKNAEKPYLSLEKTTYAPMSVRTKKPETNGRLNE
ncbi:MAG: Polynucleotide 5'-hydroxyl-kinase grc3 [Geoglossum umbratile]|nr:MAG: Polynucleotide 5'-hydroxyl-kinase grc3 [Geoglossum umbratile]